MSRKFRLISNPGGMWFDFDTDSPMPIGRICYYDELMNGKPFHVWYEGQEEYFEEVFEEEFVDVFAAPLNTHLDRVVDLEMDFYDVMDESFRNWPEEVKNIVRKRGRIDRLRLKDLVKIEQILGYKFIKIEKL